MRNKLGTICTVLGAALILGALSLFLWNRHEDEQAGAMVDELLPRVTAAAQEGAGVSPAGGSGAMPVAEINGYDYIGYISIPALGLELPVMADWDYDRLRAAPCRYYGTTGTNDLVIAAHNYKRHFGGIQGLSLGDAVYFTDMAGIVSAYEVADIELLGAAAVEEMTDSGYDLTLFTCNYSGQSRVTVRCERTGRED